MNYPALTISILALLFTVFSFWWTNWRKGKIIVDSPRSFAAFGSLEGKMILEFPFVFFNNGPMPIVVQNLRLIFSEEKEPHPLIFFNATVKKLGTDEERAFATQFPVRGREALLFICEFQRTPGGMTFKEHTYPMELQVKIGQQQEMEENL